MQRMHPGYQGCWVVFDILPDLIESFIRTDDVLPIVALPNGVPNSFGNRGLEGTDYNRNGSGMPDPYIFQNENAMEMVGHDHEGIKDHPREMARNLVPAGGHQFGNSAEHWSSVAGADRDEIGARSGVVKARDTDRPAAGFHT